MRLSISKLFDTAKVLDIFRGQNMEGLDEFVTSITELSEKIITALRNNISLADNIDCEVREIFLTHNVTAAASPSPSNRRKTVRAIIPCYSSSFDNPITSFAWQYDSAGSIRIRAKFDGDPTAAQTVRVIMFF